MLAWQMILLPPSWLIPQRLWTPFSVLVATVVMRLLSRSTAARIDVVRRTCEGHPGLPSPRALVTRAMAGHVEQHLQYLRELRPGGWKPRVELTGYEHIDRALEGRKGAIVWIAPTLYSHLVSKKGLHAAGYAVTHLSHVTHGGSTGSKLGHHLNPFRGMADARYLEERMVMTDGTELRRTRELFDRLRANSLVSITAIEFGPDRGARVVDGPFLSGEIRLPTGAPSLALASGAPLLPLFVLRRAYDRFEVVVEPPLAPSSSSDRHEAVDALVHEFMERIEHHSLEHPELYSHWYHTEPRRSEPAP